MGKRNFFTALITVLVVLLCCSCATKTKVITVPEVHRDTTYIKQQVWDSIHVHDSIYIREKNDTVRIEKWHTRYIESIRHDTVWMHRIDSVPEPYPVEVKVPRELSWWQRFRMTLGTIALGAIGVGVVLLIIKIKKKTLG